MEAAVCFESFAAVSQITQHHHHANLNLACEQGPRPINYTQVIFVLVFINEKKLYKYFKYRSKESLYTIAP